MNMKTLRKDQRGFSLIELVIVIALTAIITAAITTTIFQVFNMNTRSANRMTAVSQVQQVGKIVSEDILGAQSVNAAGGQGFPLTLAWTDPGSGNHSTVVYTLVGVPSDGSARLERTLTVTPPVGNNITTASVVAEHINPGSTETNCNPTGILPPDTTLTFKVTATVGGRLIDGAIVGGESETRVYEVKPRPGP
jgi:prepilin-type N-terminal cleavage/methylation domain-containing protein